MIYQQQNYLRCRCTLKHSLSECCIAARFGKILKRSRMRANFPTPESLSDALYERCGVHHSARTIYRYENGTHSPSIDFLVVLSLVLGPEIFSDLLTEILSPGIIGKFEVKQAQALYDSSQQMKLFN